MITIINYGLGNLNAIGNIYKKLDIPFKIASSEGDLDNVSKIILPGVGSFDFAIDKLNHSGMRKKLDHLILQKKIPVMGICVGMQILAKSSDEGKLPGLGYIDGVVKKFDTSIIKQKTHLPHMGWNNISPQQNHNFFTNLGLLPSFYFLHSYYFKCNNEEDIIAKSFYGEEFTSVLNRENIYGVQFHPEKSHKYGIQILKSFAEI
jgi:imidazole glycerol-phosphate synthase subunit HisH